jgi:hypothetical protein
MSVEFRVDSEEGLVLGVLKGEVTVDEIMAALGELFGSDEYEPHYNGITDLRDTAWESNQEDLRRLVQFLIKHRKSIGKHRSAIVVSSERAYGMSRMFEVFSEATPIKVRVFRDWDEAMKWTVEGSEDDE